MGNAVGVLYGTASSTRFDVVVTDAGLRRLDYVALHHEGHEVLCQVDDVVRKGGLRFEDALRSGAETDGRLAAQVQVVGFLDESGRVDAPRTPFAAGQEVHRADDGLVTAVLGLEPGDGAFLGHVKGSGIPVRLSMNMLAQKHVSVLAKTGAGKSYTVGVLLEEFLAAGVPLVILDPHGEYGALRHANTDAADAVALARHGLRPRSFDRQVHEYALDTRLNPDCQALRLEGINLEGREIVDLLGGKLSGGQVGLLYQAVKEVKEQMPGYTLQDIMDSVSQNRSAAKWNVINALEALEGTGLFHIRGTSVAELVRPRACSIINLKGVAPDVQEVAVARLAALLWEARKRGDVPPFILVCEEAHNFCPERGVGTAVSGPVIRTVASEGRKFGMGLVIVSQRPAKIDKNVLSQCNTQFVLKVTNPNDLKAIISSVEGITAKASDEVQRLPVGTALVAGGGLAQPVFVDVRPRLTRHGGQSVDVVAPAPHARAAPPAPTAPSSRGRRRADAPPARRGPAGADVPTPARGPPTPRLPQEGRPESVAHAGSPGVGGPAGGAVDPLPSPPEADTHNTRTHHVLARQRDSSRIVESWSDERPQPSASSRSGPSRPDTRTAAAWTFQDVQAIHRVAARVGLVGDRRVPEDTIGLLEHLARQNGRDPATRVGLYAEVARTVCHPDAPACIRCPLGAACQHHQQLRTERKKSRAGIRRLWSR